MEACDHALVDAQELACPDQGDTVSLDLRPRTVWFVVSDTDLRGLLARAQAGEDIDLLLIEFYANTKEDADGDS